MKMKKLITEWKKNESLHKKESIEMLSQHQSTQSKILVNDLSIARSMIVKYWEIISSDLLYLLIHKLFEGDEKNWSCFVFVALVLACFSKNWCNKSDA